MDLPCDVLVHALSEELDALAQKKAQLQTELEKTEVRIKHGTIALASVKKFAGLTADVHAAAETGCARKEHLIPIIEDLLKSNHELPLDELRGLTKHRLEEMGLSAAGISRSFSAALSDPRFRKADDGMVSLNEANGICVA